MPGVSTQRLAQRRGVNLPALGAVGAGGVGPQGVAPAFAVQSQRAQVALVNLAVVAHGPEHVLRHVLVQARVSCP